MAKSDCVTCGRTLYYSHPALEAKGLFSPKWSAYLERRHGKIGMRCLRCIGTENCVSCGKTLGDLGSIAGEKDNEQDCFCGTEFCVDCVKDQLTNNQSKQASDNNKQKPKANIPRLLGILIFFGIVVAFAVGDGSNHQIVTVGAIIIGGLILFYKDEHRMPWLIGVGVGSILGGIVFQVLGMVLDFGNF